MIGCNQVPVNQKISWYENAISSYGISNGGEGKEYEIEELKKVYFNKCARKTEKDEKEFSKKLEKQDDDMLVEIRRLEFENKTLKQKLERGYEICRKIVKLKAT